MDRILHFFVFIIFLAAFSNMFGQSTPCKNNIETVYDSVYFNGLFNSYVKAVNEKDIRLFSNYILTKDEFDEIINDTRIKYPQCLSTMDTLYDAVTFMNVYDKLIENSVTLNNLIVNEAKSFFSCSNTEVKKVYCDVYFTNKKSEHDSCKAIFLLAKTFKNEFKMSIQVFESKIAL